MGRRSLVTPRVSFGSGSTQWRFLVEARPRGKPPDTSHRATRLVEEVPFESFHLIAVRCALGQVLVDERANADYHSEHLGLRELFELAVISLIARVSPGSQLLILGGRYQLDLL